ncbi:MAG: hypothetical protein COX63_01775 [Candidatus Diapherotrites archaeon CG_4_10_14_0_2_um_filter_31_5]|nr:MAG: hypothetical protein COX63_01775 [Candidatus Diapherotrites archaeon CG_4_10_14_0_2_um_filter_31_5]
MQEAVGQGFKIAFYVVSGAILLTFFILTFIEGILSQISRYPESSIVFYFIAMLSIGATYWTYTKAKKALRTLN